MPTKILSVRVEEDDYKKLLSQAESQNKKISDFARQIIENKLSEETYLSSMEVTQLIELISKLNKSSKLVGIGECVIKNVRRDDKGIPVRNEKGLVQLTGSMELFNLIDEFLKQDDKK